MAEPNLLPGDLHVRGRISCGNFTPPSSSITNASVSSDAAIDASKLVHMVNVCTQLYARGTTVIALSGQDCYIAKGAGTVVAVRAAVNGTIATGGDRTVNVDLQKSTAGGAFATIMSGTVLLNSSSTLRTLATGTISSGSYVAGDMFQWVVTVAGSASAQAVGLVADFVAYESVS